MVKDGFFSILSNQMGISYRRHWPWVGVAALLGLVAAGAARAPLDKPDTSKSPERLPVIVRVDFGPTGKPPREERLMVDEGSTPKDVVSLLFPIQSGATCCNTRELAAIDGVRSDPATNRWWTCRLNGQSNFSPFLKELKAEDRVEWTYVEQLQ